MEEWRDIKGYEGLYQVSNMGRVKSLFNGRHGVYRDKILSPVKNKNDYLRVCLCKDGKQKYFLVHRLVAETFIFNPDNKPFIDHINTIRTDNRVENIRWVTRKENNNNPLTRKHYSEANKGRIISEETKKKIGKTNGKQVICIETGKVFDSIMEVERQLGINNSSISKCCKGERKTSGGYHWKYI